MSVSRRSFFARAGAIAAAQGLVMKAQQKQPPVDPGATPQDPRMGVANAEKLFKYSNQRAKVAIIKGENRRKNVFDALVAIDDQILPGLKTRKYVLIKPNGSDPSRALISTQADTVHGIMDYLAPRFKGQVVVAECCGTAAKTATSQFGWDKIFAEHKAFNMQFDVPNEDANRYELLYGIDYDMHPVPIRMGARFVDPDAFVISSAVLKTHNMVVATMTIKNMVLGAAMTPPPGVKATWGDSDKRKFHVGIRAGNYNMYLGAQMMKPNWGVGLIDGFEGMEGNGPGFGHPGAASHRHSLDGFPGGGSRGPGVHGNRRRLAGLSELRVRGRPGPIRSGQDRRGGRQDRRRATEVPAARRRGPDAGVARPDAGPAAEPGPQPASRRRGSVGLLRLGVWLDGLGRRKPPPHLGLGGCSGL